MLLCIQKYVVSKVGDGIRERHERHCSRDKQRAMELQSRLALQICYETCCRLIRWCFLESWTIRVDILNEFHLAGGALR